jgi:hypothetical protein
MDLADLGARISYFEDVLRACIPLRKASDMVADSVCQLYASKSANRVFWLVADFYRGEIESAVETPRTGDESAVKRDLPNPDVVHRQAQALLAAVACHDVGGAKRALEGMGIFGLCPPREEQLRRLEFLVGSVIGRRRLIPLVELAIFATELGADERVSKYAAESRALAPRPPQLHDLLTLDGILALNSGDVLKAKICLMESVRVCREDDFSLITCGARTLNVMLAERLIDHGEEEVVIKYLVECQHVWGYIAKQLAPWIHAIRTGKKPEFLASGLLRAMNKPHVKLRRLIIESSLLDEARYSDEHNLERGGQKGLEDLRDEYRRQMGAAIKGRLNTSDN